MELFTSCSILCEAGHTSEIYGERISIINSVMLCPKCGAPARIISDTNSKQIYISNVRIQHPIIDDKN